jgi:hypothetical protein
MVKTVRATVDLQELKRVLMEYVRSLPSYNRVNSDTFEMTVSSGAVWIGLKEPYEADCYACDGKGKRWHEEVCSLCDGTGKRTDYRTASARITAYEGAHAGELKVEVNTEGAKPDVWKPEVKKIKNFIEGLVGKPCVIVPMSKKEMNKIENQPPLDDKLRESLQVLEEKPHGDL